ncbi:alpha/beta hydrolase [Corynebacterium guangdongense]|uniref:Acetyl esterase n=1 Tax=Corynebacterium guangdongense TaxID=1783348 RepID=A0ABU1ZTS1_9CORY|nr:alpha/beta hydrolase [Corynebacterium guangdongense]MDR7328331.1 acetyl esterase [Corynebacterium guangdongense]WJZ16909.1 Carboxylesterase NlhH [Corynebacterium guangdongense]
MALDEPTAQFLAAAAENAGDTPLWEMSAAQAREATSGLDRLYGPGPQMHHSGDHRVAGKDGGQFTVRVLQPTESPNAVIVYYHGGGWVLENLQGYDTLGRQLADKSGATVVLVEYRKAPEHPFPVPVEDAWAGLAWAEEHVAQGLPLVVAGDSAGANLAAVMAQKARDEGGPELSGQVLVCPVTDADFTRDSYLAEENQTMVSLPAMEWFWDLYVPDRAQRRDPAATPINAESLAGLPLALVLTAEHDVLRDEGEAYAEALRDAGVDVEHHRWEGQMHTFFSMVNVLPASAEAIDLVTRRIRERV